MASQGETPWRVPGKWSVSPYAFEPEVRKGWKLPKKVTIHDVTLRDGEQTPGVVFRKEEKLKIAHALEDMGVQRIEGGMVAVSDEDFDALATMARELKKAEVCGFCRARKDDIERAIQGQAALGDHGNYVPWTRLSRESGAAGPRPSRISSA